MEPDREEIAKRHEVCSIMAAKKEGGLFVQVATEIRSDQMWKRS